MIFGYLTRLLRRKFLYGSVFVVFLIYFIVSIHQQPRYFSVGEGDSSFPLMRNLESFNWHLDNEEVEINKTITCRNSIQGKLLMVDDRGYLCTRYQILPTGCCDQSMYNVDRYSCKKCKDTGCCSIYEYCVSCCLNPNKKEVLQMVLSKAPAAFHAVFSSVNDHYELCLAKCRTSSQSVRHENSYRDPIYKHCYSDQIPDDVNST